LIGSVLATFHRVSLHRFPILASSVSEFPIREVQLFGYSLSLALSG
jgi:hypothetical protein